MECSEVQSKRIKLLSASVGVSAVLAMGGLAVAFSDVSVAEPGDLDVTGPVEPTEATTGQTVVQEPSEVTSSPISAVPQITGPAPLPPEEQGLPGD